VEGFEWEVLRAFPWHRYRFGALTIEHSFHKHYDKAIRITALLLEHGYVRERRWNDDLWLSKEVAEAVVERQREKSRRRRYKPRRIGSLGMYDFEAMAECPRSSMLAI